MIRTRKLVRNDRPVVGPFGVNRSGSGDMYYKGGNMLHTIRQIVNGDAKWRGWPERGGRPQSIQNAPRAVERPMPRHRP